MDFEDKLYRSRIWMDQLKNKESNRRDKKIELVGKQLQILSSWGGIWKEFMNENAEEYKAKYL